MATHLTMDKAGCVVIPESLREQLRLEPGDSLEMETAGEAITLRVGLLWRARSARLGYGRGLATASGRTRRGQPGQRPVKPCDSWAVSASGCRWWRSRATNMPRPWRLQHRSA